MFADVEIISNNTYSYNQFTYSIPDKFQNNLSVGTLVKVEFRNKIVDALIVNIKSETQVKNIKKIINISKYKLTSDQFIYCKFIALSNMLNCGILLHNLIDIKVLNSQKTLRTRSINNINFQEFNNFNFKNNKLINQPAFIFSFLNS